MDNRWSHYFIKLLGAAEFRPHIPLMQGSLVISLRERKEERRSGGGRQEKKTVIWLSGGSIWFRDFSVHPDWLQADWGLSLVQNDDKLPYPPFILLCNTPPDSPSKKKKKKNPKTPWIWLGGIIEEANNEGAWWGGCRRKRRRGVSSDPQKTLSNKTGTLRGWQ